MNVDQSTHEIKFLAIDSFKREKNVWILPLSSYRCICIFIVVPWNMALFAVCIKRMRTILSDDANFHVILIYYEKIIFQPIIGWIRMNVLCESLATAKSNSNVLLYEQPFNENNFECFA